uniref:Uncharacterized protein n=1 Tax=Setaria viridis TaxID=4556 RepID=A0A4U6VPK0_SETVI|nr:hypothetical protein SEVIR_2G030100v2 [Setaria viridis]
MVDLVLGLVVSALAAGSSLEAGAPLARLPIDEWGATVDNLCIFGAFWWCSAPLCRAVQQVWPQEHRRFLVGVMMWSCKSYERKVYPIGVGVSNDNVDWVSFPSVEAFAVMLSAMSMVF